MTFEFRTTSGKQPRELLLGLDEAIAVTVGDCLTVGNYLKEQILDRTWRGQDVRGAPFAPYSTKGPYYYYPSPGGNKKQRKAAVNRLLKKTTEVANVREEYLGGTSEGGRKTRTGLGIRFESYADFKQSLGRTNVDLTGPRAPLMLQALAVRAGTDIVTGGINPVGPMDSRDPANSVAVGIYAPDKVARARGHQEGSRYLPKREWLGATGENAAYALKLVAARITARAKRVLGG